MIPPGPSPARCGGDVFFPLAPKWSSVQSSRWCNFGDSPGSISLKHIILTGGGWMGMEVLLLSNLKKKHMVRQELMFS